jgi:glycyl-tRNA synthetase beta chain
VGKVVSLADRLDSLTGIFAIGVKPSGNKDPFALRRAALGLIRILLGGELDIGLDRLLEISTTTLQQQLPVDPNVHEELRQFIVERLKHYLRDQGYSSSLVEAALDAPLSTLPDLTARLAALDAFMAHDDSARLAAANKRIGNILRKSKLEVVGFIEEDLLIIDEERTLFKEIRNISVGLVECFKQNNYAAALTLLAGLSAGIEAFFDKVLVMDDDAKIRLNRLTLLAELKGLFDRIANFALLG